MADSKLYLYQTEDGTPVALRLIDNGDGTFSLATTPPLAPESVIIRERSTYSSSLAPAEQVNRGHRGLLLITEIYAATSVEFTVDIVGVTPGGSFYTIKSTYWGGSAGEGYPGSIYLYPVRPSDPIQVEPGTIAAKWVNFSLPDRWAVAITHATSDPVEYSIYAVLLA